ncbi:MAG: hypothetical protein PHY02_10220 [Phycisphaerae bacterium]|nr:hypothetical protein [Phycisphaerae bacterium]
MLPESEIEVIRNEVKDEINNLIIGCESLDMELAFKVFSKTSDFFMIASNGYYYDYQTFFNNNKNYLDNCSEFKLTTLKEEIKVLADDLVIVSWIYKAIATLKTGEQDIWDKAGATFLFKKIDDDWKVINYQESSLPPERK